MRAGLELTRKFGSFTTSRDTIGLRAVFIQRKMGNRFMSSFPGVIPKLNTKITPQMCEAIVIPLMISLTAKSIRENPEAVELYLKYKGGDYSKLSLSDEQKLAEEIVRKGDMDHVAIRSIMAARSTSSSNIALQGLDPFKNRMEAIGFCHLVPDSDVYKFPNGVEGIHLELHPSLMSARQLNFNGPKHAPDFAKIFMSHMFIDDMPKSFNKELAAALENGKDTMTVQELSLLQRVREGENLNDKELDILNAGLFRFMTRDFVEIPKGLMDAMTAELEEHPENSMEFKKTEYPRSRVVSNTNHCAYNTPDLPALYKIMENEGLGLIPVQHMGHLRQFGVNTSSLSKQWVEFIERQKLKNEAGHNVDYNGKECKEGYPTRGFKPNNAYALFSAGNAK